MVVARYPAQVERLGSNSANATLFRKIVASGREGIEDGVGLGGEQRIFGFVPLAQTVAGQAYLWISVPKSTFIEAAEHRSRVILLVQAALLVLTFGALWWGTNAFMVRRINALARAAQELGEGNLTARVESGSNRDELGQLTQTFNRMADGLQAKETQLSRAVRALRVLSAGNRTMLHSKQEEQHLLEEMCRAIGEAGGYHLVWVGYAENDAKKSIRPVAQWGYVAESHFEGIELTWDETESGSAPPGSAIRTAAPVVVQDTQSESGAGSWREHLMRCGCGACLALPLRIDDRVIGVLNICAAETGAFSEDEVKLLSESAADISFGIASRRAAVEQARMTVALGTAEARFKAAAEANLDALFIACCVRNEAGQVLDFEFTDVNPRAEEMLGMAREKIIGQRLCELIPINRTGGFLQRYVQVVATGNPLDEEFPIEIPELKAKWLRHQVVRVGDGVAIFSRDITQWKEFGAQLKDSEETLRAITASANDAVLMLDDDETIAFWNPAAEKIFGYSEAEALGKNLHELLTPERFQDVSHAAFHHFRSTGEGAAIGKTLELAGLRKDGSEFLLDLSLSAVKLKGKWNAVGIVRDITERKKGELAVLRLNRTLRTLSACNETLVHANSESDLLNSICRLIVEEGGYGLAWVGFAEQDPAKTVRVVAQYGTDEGYLKSAPVSWADTEHGRGPAGTANRMRATQVNQNTLTSPEIAPWREAAIARGFMSNIALPLQGSSGTMGVLGVSALEPNAFNQDEVKLLEELADDLAFGIRTLRTRDERDRIAHAHQHHAEILRKSLEDSIQAIANTVEVRDPYTAGHQTRVGKLAVAIASALGLPEDEIHGIQLAASIHDLGKIQVPAEILSKPGKLTDIEFMLIKQHPQAGHDILKDIEFPWPIASMVLQHHERLNGSGYPQGLKGDEILQGARILSVADVVEAMVSHRPYRPTLGIDAALAEIENRRGTTFDPDAVDACLKLFHQNQFTFHSA